ncbi:A/G-specific adenine glycosylase [Macrococcoides caseolyticum]|uniref:A/G-specific adenine glycosylase n=1 Tax=Macrococcoides caseolyticum TaxID=69966 RepID=UPI000A292162|nr:A/G-specific adenine glycosylase [Macrococcus caseolyticus]ARQ05203.1 putative A/G-specific adenine glycosylase YfhQ [Macrococcus caseolyticus]PKE06033.1 A/G-specific adenine glycosylase [Macrococcus caseolyticus]PKE23215.1 A/G-specific adenine glycosylase [Macrococcus caseolyticus]PKE52331.1 A/G-specific adenine glycosylase [Macrococcus caseolyticus]PKF37820.1 A/G-specific adenine glycosylase [Macrococcus caseolyticus]
MLNKQQISQHLLDWFYKNKREMPWRETKDPYKIWLSEVMLQQTQVNTVKPYYLKFTERFPDIRTLASAEIDEVTKYWEGLGYYSRVRNFHSAVKEVQESYNGVVPNNPEDFLKLKGVGPYTQGAVMSIAFNHQLPAVDGNVYRVFSRLDNDDFDISSSSARRHFEDKVMDVIPKAAGDFNEALMELGATVCTPKSPLCMFCPVQQHCESYEAGTVQLRPVKLKKIKKKAEHWKVLVIMHGDKIYIEQRPSTGLLQSMWQFPMFNIDTHQDTIEEQLNMSLYVEADPFMSLKHQFTHVTWDMEVYRAVALGRVDKARFIDIEEKERFNFPVSMTKIFKKYIDELK